MKLRADLAREVVELEAAEWGLPVEGVPIDERGRPLERPGPHHAPRELARTLRMHDPEQELPRSIVECVAPRASALYRAELALAIAADQKLAPAELDDPALEEKTP